MLSKRTNERQQQNDNAEESSQSYNEPSLIPSPVKKKHKVFHFKTLRHSSRLLSLYKVTLSI